MKRYKMKSKKSRRKFSRNVGVHRKNRTAPNMRTGTRL